MKIKDFVSQNGDYDAFYSLPPKIRNAYHNYVRNCINSGNGDKTKRVGEWLQDYQHKGEGAGLMPLKEMANALNMPLTTLAETLQRALKHFYRVVEQNPKRYDLLSPLLKTRKDNK